MGEIAKLTINWSGFTGGPGFTNLYFRDFETFGIDQAIVDGAVTKVDAFIAAIRLRMPTVVDLQTSNVVEIIEETNGELLRFMTGSPAALTSGTIAGAYSAPVGAVVNWYTDVVHDGRRIRGRTFLVPLGGSQQDTDGTLVAAALTALNTAAAALYDPVGAGDLGIWARPKLSDPNDPESPMIDGEWARVTAHNIPDKMAVLRSRRD